METPVGTREQCIDLACHQIGTVPVVTVRLHPSWITEIIQKKSEEGYLIKVKRLNRIESKGDPDLRTYRIRVRRKKAAA